MPMREGEVAQGLEKLLIVPVLIDATHEAGIHLDIVEAQIGEFLKFGKMVAKMLNPDAAAQLSEGAAEITEGFKVAKNAVLRHFNPQPAA